MVASMDVSSLPLTLDYRPVHAKPNAVARSHEEKGLDPAANQRRGVGADL
ncbi:hypothetical protein PI125_g19425 [Phytophthora idaei]|nr:hypothetical protein PI125_g19425 [Phytophthora idaei]